MYQMLPQIVCILNFGLFGPVALTLLNVPLLVLISPLKQITTYVLELLLQKHIIFCGTLPAINIIICRNPFTNLHLSCWYPTKHYQSNV